MRNTNETLVTARAIDPDWLVNRACEMTMHGQKSSVSLSKLYKAEHSPIRCKLFWIEMKGIPSFVSVHLVRHKHGVEHYVQSMRDDLFADKDEVVTRDTPVNHGMLINAQALITMSRKRLCYKAHAKTVGVMIKIRTAISAIDEELGDFMVPECIYRGNNCHELKECTVGLERVVRAYTLAKEYH